MLTELAWLARRRFAALLPGRGDASLDALRRRFDAELPGCGEVDHYAWFTAWLLVVKPALSGRLAEARVQRDQATSRACALPGEILRREHDGDQHELVNLGQELSRLHGGLYLTPTWRHVAAPVSMTKCCCRTSLTLSFGARRRTMSLKVSAQS